MEHDERRAAGPTGMDRRDFLRSSGGGLGALSLMGASPGPAAPPPEGGRAVILLMLVGGPSQLETWDPKPDAPEDVRGPFGSIATRTPGLRISEHLPRLAMRSDRFAIVRSLHHDQAPIHEIGLQLLQTGKVSRTDEHPHFGSLAAASVRGAVAAPPFAILPGPIGHTGVMLPKGQSAGGLAPEYAPVFLDPSRPTCSAVEPRIRTALDVRSEAASTRESYGGTRFGRHCLAARRLVEEGVRVVVVNMYDSVFDQVSWDCHGAKPFSTFDDLRREVLPTFDRAFSGLIDDLEGRGMLDSTLVAAVGEFGRTPRINVSGGRDHWPRVWSAAMAGGGVRGGAVLGASDGHAAEPADRPVDVSEWHAAIRRAILGRGDRPGPMSGAAPLRELID